MPRVSRVSLILTIMCSIATPLAAADSVEDGFKSIFNGRDLTDWDGEPAFWSVEDGAITGQTTPDKSVGPRCTYLIWRGGKPADFELRLDFKLTTGNSGVQFRSRELPNFDMLGYQADMCTEGFWYGMLFETTDRAKIALRGEQVAIDADGRKSVTPLGDPAELLSHVKQGDWNEYQIIAQGNQITLLINGAVMSRTTDHQAGRAAADGLIGFQIHPGPPLKVQFKNIRIKQL